MTNPFLPWVYAVNTTIGIMICLFSTDDWNTKTMFAIGLALIIGVWLNKAAFFVIIGCGFTLTCLWMFECENCYRKYSTVLWVNECAYCLRWQPLISSMAVAILALFLNCLQTSLELELQMNYAEIRRNCRQLRECCIWE